MIRVTSGYEIPAQEAGGAPRYLLGPDHDAVGLICEGCGNRLKAGEWISLVKIGPGDDEDERANARNGRRMSRRHAF